MKTTQVKRRVSDRADAMLYGWAAGRPPRYSGVHGGPCELCNVWLMELHPAAGRNRSSEPCSCTGQRCLLATGFALLKPWAKPEGTLTSTDKNLGAISQRWQHLTSSNIPLVHAHKNQSRQGESFPKLTIPGPTHQSCDFGSCLDCRQLWFWWGQSFLNKAKNWKMLILHCAAFYPNAPFSVPPMDVNTSALPGELPSAMRSLAARGVVWGYRLLSSNRGNRPAKA